MSNLRSPEGIKCRTRHKAKGIFHSRDEFECLLSLHLALRITLGKAGCTIRMKAQESFLVSRIYLPIGTKGRSLCSNLLPSLPQLNWSEEFNPTKNRKKKFITRLDDNYQRAQNYLLWGRICTALNSNPKAAKKGSHITAPICQALKSLLNLAT
jgi:hypothetical protein